MLKRKKIAVIGAGNMAEALIAGLLKKAALPPNRIIATDVDARKLADVRERFHVQVSQDNAKSAKGADIVILAVKPQVMDDVFKELDVSHRADQLIISVAAGVPIAAIIAGLHPQACVVRAMPNTPAIVLEGVTALAVGPGVTPEHVQAAQAVFEAVGEVVVVDESQLDAVTGLSGGGPAYVYLFIEALADGGVMMGLSRPHAQRLAAQTALGAAKMVLETKEHPGVLKDRVTSPGGTTIAGVRQLEKGRLRGTVMSAVESATIRCQELGRRARASRTSSGESRSTKRAASGTQRQVEP